MTSSSSLDRDLKNSVEILPDRLYYVALTAPPAANQSRRHFFSIDNELVYWNFFLDFGPLNLGQLFRFSQKINGKLNDPKLKDKVIYYYSTNNAQKRANAVYLVCAWSMLYLHLSPESASQPFKHLTPSLPPWHDATPSSCSYRLTIYDTLKGIAKAQEHKFFSLEGFDVEEYEHFEQVENGDLNWCVDGKFLAFAGPHASREISPGGYHTLCPADYVPYFKRKNVTLVVRLNKKYYPAEAFTDHGIDHIDLEFLDGSNPPDHILNKFLEKCEETKGAVAVHCKAGLGRTGCCIGAYLMKHYKLTAEETIGWLRVARPGMVIGPQQQWMQDMQARMWREGEAFRLKHGAKLKTSAGLLEEQGADAISRLDITTRTASISSATTASQSSKIRGRSDADSIVSSEDKRQFYVDDSEGKTAQGDLLRLRREQHKNLAASSSYYGGHHFPIEPNVSSTSTKGPDRSRILRAGAGALMSTGESSSLRLARGPNTLVSSVANGPVSPSSSAGAKSPVSPASATGSGSPKGSSGFSSFFSSWRG